MLRADTAYKEASRRRDGTLIFRDFGSFRPNLSPKEILQAGAFGGTYFGPSTRP